MWCTSHQPHVQTNCIAKLTKCDILLVIKMLVNCCKKMPCAWNSIQDSIRWKKYFYYLASRGSQTWLEMTIGPSKNLRGTYGANVQLIQVRWWGWELRFLWLEGFSNFPHCGQNPQTRVQIGFLKGCDRRVKVQRKTSGFTVRWTSAPPHHRPQIPLSWMFPATALASMTIGEMVCDRMSDACLTVSRNRGSSEFSTSLLATSSTRLARLAMLVAPATSIWGWTLAMATLHLSMSFFMASSEASNRDLVSMASSTKPGKGKNTHVTHWRFAGLSCCCPLGVGKKNDKLWYLLPRNDTSQI